MESITGSLQYFDSVVVAFADTIGTMVFPCILNVSTPVAYHICNTAVFRNLGRTVGIQPFGQLCPLKKRHGHFIYVVKALKCLIGFVKIRICFQKFINPFLDGRGFHAVFVVYARLFCEKHAYGFFEEFIVRIRWLQVALKLPADVADAVIQMFDDMEHINADDSMWKDFFCNRDIAIVQVTAVIPNLVTFMLWKLPEVFFEIGSPYYRKDIHHGTIVAIDNVCMVFGFAPAFTCCF